MMMAGSAGTNQQLLGQESAPFPPQHFKDCCESFMVHRVLT